MDESFVIGAHGKVIDKDIESVFEDKAFGFEAIILVFFVDFLGEFWVPLTIILEEKFGEVEWFPDAHATVTKGADGIFKEVFLGAVVQEGAVRVGEDELDAPEGVLFGR